MTLSQDEHLIVADHQRNQPDREVWYQPLFYWPWLLAAAAWVVIFLATWTHHTYLFSHGYLIERSGLPLTAALALFLASWQVMTLAMMAPSTLPILYIASHGARRWTWSVEAAFLAGYGSIWTVFASAAFTLDATIHWMVDQGTWLSAHTAVIGATTLALAGAFQLSPLKRMALSACHPGATTSTHRLDVGASWHLGMRHGLSCVGSGWALMLVMFGIGMGNLLWMAVLTSLMVVEKNGPDVRWLRPASGAVLLVLATLWLIHPALLPSGQL